MQKDNIHRELVELRKFLEDKWEKWGVQYNKPSASTGEGMCRYSVEFLDMVVDGTWRIAGGESLPDQGPAGFFDGSTWHGHYWLTDGALILDVTANQFGGDEVIVATVEDSRYRENYTSLEISEHLGWVQHRAHTWADDYFQLLSSKA